ncbi:MAG TPA: hypothetical protein VIL22_11910 [Paenibacillaceae bacterium]
MNFKWTAFAAAALLVLAALLGGWTAWRHYGMEQPLHRLAQQMPGVLEAETEWEADRVRMRLRLAPDADLAAIVRRLETEGSAALGRRTLEFEFAAESGERLERIWQDAFFEVAEAMEHRRYSEVRDLVLGLAERHPGIEATVRMDDRYVYIRLKDGDRVKFILLPRETDAPEVETDA